MINVINFKALFMAIYLFFVGLVYGDEPIRIEYSYEIPSQVTMYEAGDSVKIDISVTNVGRPFKGFDSFYDSIEIEAFCYDNDSSIIVYDSKKMPSNNIIPNEIILKTGHTDFRGFMFFIPVDAPEKVYNIKVEYYGKEYTFENVFEVKENEYEKKFSN